MTKYRYDSRNETQFKEDIKQCHAIENQLMTEYVKNLNDRRPKGTPEYIFLDHGIDNSGEFIENCKNVDCRADFILAREGVPNRKIDIKFCRQERSRFHLKINQLEKYLKEDVCIINFMGIDTPNKRYCILRPSDIEYWLEHGTQVKMWYKPCLRLFNKDFDWYKI